MINEKLRGRYQYFGITDNAKSINRYLYEVDKTLFKYLNKRSQRRSYNYEEYREMKKKYPLLPAKIQVSIFDI